MPISAHVMPFYLLSAFEPETLLTKALYNEHPNRSMAAILKRPWRRVMSSTAFLRSSCCSYQIHVSAAIFLRSRKIKETSASIIAFPRKNLSSPFDCKASPRPCFSKAIDSQ